MKTALITWLCILVTGVVALFWRMEWVYNQPTPVPLNYHEVATGSRLQLPVVKINRPDKPLFLHFFNPDCPCSRFNIDHFKTLVKTYGEEVNFAIVPISKKYRSSAEIKKMFGLSVPVILDTALAAQCGVYSTPQAVLVDTEQHLYFRGNYNKSRYCTNKNSDYARIAIDSLLNRKKLSGLDQYAYQAYGCELPRLNAEHHE